MSRSKMSSIGDRSFTDRDRMTSRPGVPASTSSSGTVMRFSTSAGASPIPRVWISTFGGENSGKTSTGIFWIWPMPTSIRPAARATTRKRNRRAAATIVRISLFPRS